MYQDFVRRYARDAQAADARYAIGRIRERAGDTQAAIDAYAECFMYEDPPGSGRKRYYRSLAVR